MDVSQLEAFVAVARLGHLTRAAEERHLSQPALSAQIKGLEQEVGQRLFDRTPKGMALTEAGGLYLEYAKEALGALERGQEALGELEGMLRGSLSVGGGASAMGYLLPALLGRFHRRYPGVRLLLREQGSARTLDRVVEGTLDVGVVTVGGEQRLSKGTRGRLVMQPWSRDALRLVVPEGHRLCGASSFRWAQLDGEPLVHYHTGSALRAMIDARFRAASVEPEIAMELRSLETMKQMVAQGIGVAFLSSFALEASQGLACQEQPIERELALVYRKDRSLPRAAQAFLAFLLEG